MNLLDKLQKLYMHEWNVHLEIFSRPQVRKFQAIFASPNRYFTENSHWVPLKGEIGCEGTLLAQLIPFPLLLSFCHAGLAGMSGCLMVIESNNNLEKMAQYLIETWQELT